MEQERLKMQEQKPQGGQQKDQKSSIGLKNQQQDLSPKIQYQKYSIVIRQSEPNSRSAKQLRTANSFNIYDFMYIDEAALKGNKSTNYSFMSQAFDYKKASKIILTDDYIMLKMEDMGVPKFSTEYLVKRLRSFGDQKLYEIASYVEKFEIIMKNVSKIMQQFDCFFNQQALIEMLKSYKGKTYFGVYHVYQNESFIIRGTVISFGVIKMLGYTPQQLAIKFTRLGAIRNLQVFSPGSYSDILLNYFKLFSNFCEIMFEKGFSLELWKQLTKNEIRSKTELYTRTQQKILAETKLHLPNPCVVINEIVSIIFKGRQFKSIGYGNKSENSEKTIVAAIQGNQMDQDNQILPSQSQLYDNIEKMLVKNEQKSLVQIKKVAANTLLLNDGKTCGYRVIDKQQLIEKRKLIKKPQKQKRK